MKTLVVKFDDYSAKDYHYVVDDNASVKVKDRAVVHNGSEFRLVTVINILNGVSSRATKTVVAIINTDVYNTYLENNKKLEENKALYQRLEQLLAQESENNKYRLLAQSNSEAAAILAKLGIN